MEIYGLHRVSMCVVLVAEHRARVPVEDTLVEAAGVGVETERDSDLCGVLPLSRGGAPYE